MSIPATSSPATLALLIFSLNKLLTFFDNLLSVLLLPSLESVFFKNERSNFIFFTFSIMLVLGRPFNFVLLTVSTLGFETVSITGSSGVFSRDIFSVEAVSVVFSEIC